jgi:hypothetical protein
MAEPELPKIPVEAIRVPEEIDYTNLEKSLELQARDDKTCLTYWFPKLVAAGVPVPKTEIVDAGPQWSKMVGIFDDPVRHPTTNAAAGTVIGPLIEKIHKASEGFDLPFFLRTGQGSGKHNWDKCCYVTERYKIQDHVQAIIEWSEMVSFIGNLSYRYWAVREFLPTIPLFECRLYGGMPFTREYRLFVNDGLVEAVYPYWPPASVRAGDPDRTDWTDLYRAAYDHHPPMQVHNLAARVSVAVGGKWSVDVLETANGWYVTDMAEAEKSFRWSEKDGPLPWEPHWYAWWQENDAAHQKKLAERNAARLNLLRKDADE